MPALLGRAMQPADYEPGRSSGLRPPLQDMGQPFQRRPLDLSTRHFVLNGTARTLIGSHAATFWLGRCGHVDTPETQSRGTRGSLGFNRFWFLLGHLKPGVSAREAQADLAVVAQRLAKVYPKDYPKHFTVEVRSLADLVVGRFRTTSLHCSRGRRHAPAHRLRERRKLAAGPRYHARKRVRHPRRPGSEPLATGASTARRKPHSCPRWRGLGACSHGEASISDRRSFRKKSFPPKSAIRLNVTVLLFTLAVSVMTALIFGLVPALQTARHNVNDSLRDSGKGVSGGFRHGRFRDAVVVLEVAVSLTLLVGAGLLMRSFVALREVHLGLQPDHILVARLPLPKDRYKTADQIAGFFRPLLLRLKAMPGVVDATETSTLPPYGGIPTDIEILGKTHPEKWNTLVSTLQRRLFSSSENSIPHRTALQRGRSHRCAETRRHQPNFRAQISRCR